MQVSLSYVVLTADQPVAVACEEDATALALLLGLDDEGFAALVVELFFEVLLVCGQDPSLGEEIILMRHDSLHIGQISRQQVLPSNHIARRDVISPLIRLHLHQ